MPSTTTNLALYKPDLGENDVADELNANTETIDQRFGGTVGHTHAGTAGEGPKIPVTSIAATGSLGATKFLRADGRWATAGGGGGVTDHDELTGLADDDHTQYYNQARGDARYLQRSSNLSDLSSATTARTNLGAAAATHTHAAADIASGTIDTARLGSGTADATKVLRGDQTWADMVAVTLDLNDLGDVEITTPADNQVLTYDSTSSTWKNEAAAGGGGTLDSLSDTTITTPSDGQVLTYDSGTSQWVNEALPGGGGAVATDAIWDAAGDLAVGSGANTAARLGIGSSGHVLTSTGSAAAWQAPASSAPDPVTTLRLVDDFLTNLITTGNISTLGWGFSNGTTGVASSTADHPGVLSRSTGGTINTITSLYLDTTIVPGNVHPSSTFDMTWIIQLVLLPDTIVRAGLLQALINPPTNGIYIEKLAADSSWFGVTRAAGSETRTAALATVTDQYVKLRLRRVNGTTIGFSVDGGTEVTQTATIPSVLLAPVVMIVNTAASNRQLNIDLFTLTISGLTR